MTSHPALPLSRRTVVAGGLGAVALAGLGVPVAGAAPRAPRPRSATALAPVDPLPAGAPDRTAFAPNEQVFGSFLVILAPLANSVVDDDPQLYGWMADGWWRTPNHPRNSRIMEHVATLSWFLANDRAWNPYFGDPALEARLDAAIGYYLSLQGPSGAWPVTYEEESLATTGFGAAALAETLRNLQLSSRLPQRRAEIETALRAACGWLMDPDQDFWGPPAGTANQPVGGVAAVAEVADVLGDPTVAAGVDERLAYLAQHAQAPGGWFHEPMGYDSRYSVSVQLPDMAVLARHTANPVLTTMVTRFTDFYGYAMVREPGVSGWFQYSAINARTAATFRDDVVDAQNDFSALSRALIAGSPQLAAFLPSSEGVQDARAAWAADPAPVPPRVKGDTDPRRWMHNPDAPNGVSRATRVARIRELRYLTENTFTELRQGPLDAQLLFVRRPGYYLGSAYGRRASALTRTGPGLLWHPDAGMFLLSLNGNAAGDDCWTTLGPNGLDTARTNVVTTYHEGPDATGPQLARADVTGFDQTFTTRSTSPGGAVVEVTHGPASVTRRVTTGGASTDVVPLVLRPSDQLTFSDGTVSAGAAPVTTEASGVTIARGAVRIRVEWQADAPVSLAPTPHTFFGGSRALALLRIGHDGTFVHTISTETVA